jgi:hypothetical protein
MSFLRDGAKTASLFSCDPDGIFSGYRVLIFSRKICAVVFPPPVPSTA